MVILGCLRTDDRVAYEIEKHETLQKENSYWNALWDFVQKRISSQ